MCEAVYVECANGEGLAGEAFVAPGTLATCFSWCISWGGGRVIYGGGSLGCVWQGVVGEAIEAVMGGRGLGNGRGLGGIVWRGGFMKRLYEGCPSYGSPSGECFDQA